MMAEEELQQLERTIQNHLDRLRTERELLSKERALWEVRKVVNGVWTTVATVYDISFFGNDLRQNANDTLSWNGVTDPDVNSYSVRECRLVEPVKPTTKTVSDDQ